MGFNFGFFGSQEHRVFDYKPRYYDKEKDELRQKFGRVDGSASHDEKGGYVPGSVIKGSFRDGHYQKTRNTGSRAGVLLGILALLLIFAILIFIAKLWPAVTGQL